MISIGKIEKAYFNIDSSKDYYEGYHNPEFRWNGWATPYFTKDVANKILENMSINDCKISYDKDNNQYIVIFNNDDEQKEIYEMEIINTDEGKKEVYAIGSCSWVWDNYSLDELKNESNIKIIKSDDENKKEYPIDMDY